MWFISFPSLLLSQVCDIEWGKKWVKLPAAMYINIHTHIHNTHFYCLFLYVVLLLALFRYLFKEIFSVPWHHHMWSNFKCLKYVYMEHIFTHWDVDNNGIDRKIVIIKCNLQCRLKMRREEWERLKKAENKMKENIDLKFTNDLHNENGRNARFGNSSYIVNINPTCLTFSFFDFLSPSLSFIVLFFSNFSYTHARLLSDWMNGDGVLNEMWEKIYSEAVDGKQ
jgi:hypothetical protein